MKHGKTCASFVASAVALALLVHATDARADTLTGWFTVNQLVDGYQVDALLVKPSTGTPVATNPSSCDTTDYYVLTDYNPTAYDYKNKAPMLMGAFLGRKEVQFLISGCALGATYGGATSGRPRITQVFVREPGTT